MINPIISAVICTHNRAPYLRKALHSLIQQSLPQEQYEILVVDNCSTDTTKEVIEEFARAGPVHYLYESRLGLSHARNAGWRSARGRYVAYLDDDAIACPGWLEKILEVFETVKPRPGCVGGRTEAIWEAQRPKWLGDHLLHGLTIVDWSDVPHPLSDLAYEWLVGANLALPRETLEQLGGFTDRLDREGCKLLSSGDVYLQKQVLKAGLACFYHPQISVQHHVFPSRLVQEWFKQRYYWQGISDAVMILLEDAPSNAAIVWLIFGKILRLLARPIRLLNLAVTTSDPGRFTEACFTLITIGQIRGLLAALRH
jgi:glycosyltransferase involved in cell wall biosynthesis